MNFLNFLLSHFNVAFMSDKIPDMSHFLELHHGFHLLSVSFIVFLTEESHEIFIASE